MRRTVFVILGVLEFAVAAVLVAFGCQLPGSADVRQTFDRVQRVTDGTNRQVCALRGQVHELRRPRLRELAVNLEKHTQTVTKNLRSHTANFQAVRDVGDALGEVSKGLDGLAQTLDPSGVGQVGKALGATAEFLERVAPAAATAAQDLEQSTADLKADAGRLKLLLREAPPNLKGVRETHDGLARFSEGLATMHAALKFQRLETMREGFQGLESALTSGAEQVEKLSGYSYPVLTLNGGFKPSVEYRRFWPSGEQIAQGMRKAATGATAATKELDALAADLPKMRVALDESRKVADRTREALAEALKHQEKIEPLLKDAPAHAARLAEQLPRLGEDLARILRDAEKFKDVAASLRQAEKAMDKAMAHWPEAKTTLGRTAAFLRATQKQLDEAYERRREYDSALNQTVVLTEQFTQLVPLFVAQVELQLGEQEHALADLGQSIDEVNAALPTVADTTSRLMGMGRLLVWLVAAIVALHGTYLVLSARLGRRFSV